MSMQGISLFEQFWSHYPARHKRKLGKFQCQQLFEQFSEEEQAACILAAKHYAAACKPSGDEFRPLPRDPIRFLKQDWWRDWVDGDALACDFRSLSVCEQPVEAGTTTCEFHRKFREMRDRKRA